MLLNEQFFLRSRVMILLTTLCLLFVVSPGSADPGDTTVVYTFDHQNHNNGNSGRSHTEQFEFPDGSVSYNQVIMTYLMSCPNGNCDPWDRLGRLFVVQQIDDTTEEQIEIARIITPYNIVGGGGPGTCTWEFDMTEYLPILRNEVTMRSWIDTWIGSGQGWECTCTFYFIEGELSHTPYRVINLWDIGYLAYGNPENPPADRLGEWIADIDEFTDFVTFRVWTTGHGQGNTHNAAEFSRKDHGVWLDFQNFEQELWRNNCEYNQCSPQGGTWTFDRAGWCPGDRVYPWEITEFEFNTDADLSVFYYVEPYENLCRPNNPDCISGVTCPDCNYNYNGHGEPYYVTSGQLILWASEIPEDAGDTGPVLPGEFRLNQNFPNPFNPMTVIQFMAPSRSIVQLTVHDLTGREVATLVDGSVEAGVHEIQFDGSQLATGVYFYTLRSGNVQLTKKMLLIK
jgi:hypothetical protein